MITFRLEHSYTGIADYYSGSIHQTIQVLAFRGMTLNDVIDGLKDNANTCTQLYFDEDYLWEEYHLAVRKLEEDLLSLNGSLDKELTSLKDISNDEDAETVWIVFELVKEEEAPRVTKRNLKEIRENFQTIYQEEVSSLVNLLSEDKEEKLKLTKLLNEKLFDLPSAYYFGKCYFENGEAFIDLGKENRENMKVHLLNQYIKFYA